MLLRVVCILGAAQDPTLFDAAEEAQVASMQAQAAGADARAAASQVGTRGYAEEAAAAEQNARSDAISAEFAAPTSDQAHAEAGEQVKLADASLTQANAAVSTADGLAKTAAARGTEVGTEETHKALGDLMKDFQDWRFSVLHDPESEARKAAQKAEQPYIDALMKTEKRIQDLQQRSDGMAAQASSLRNIAVGTANVAVAQQAIVDLKGAQQNMMNAHQMMAQANNFDKQAQKLGEQAKVLQLNVPGYQAAAQMTAAYFGHRYNPDGRPPPPVNPFGFTLPPPPVDVFLQKNRQRKD